MGLTTEEINSAIEHQLDIWPMARDNFFRLMDTKRKPLQLGDMQSSVQLNPARIISTGARIDRKSIESRPCFLCRANRPDEQEPVAWHNSVLDDWELLVNPFPILPVHFTVAHKSHRPQDTIPLEMAAMAEEAKDLVFFFNGARAGASAPDHLHVQAVLRQELPLMKIVEEHHRPGSGAVFFSDECGLQLPYHFISLIVTPDENGMKLLAKVPYACGIDATTGTNDTRLVNAFFWFDVCGGYLRIAIVPRKSHRPSCYGNAPSDFMISPGAIDMAGLMISVRMEDFDRMDEKTARSIYEDVAFSRSIPDYAKSPFHGFGKH